MNKPYLYKTEYYPERSHLKKHIEKEFNVVWYLLSFNGVTLSICKTIKYNRRIIKKMAYIYIHKCEK